MTRHLQPKTIGILLYVGPWIVTIVAFTWAILDGSMKIELSLGNLTNLMILTGFVLGLFNLFAYTIIQTDYAGVGWVLVAVLGMAGVSESQYAFNMGLLVSISAICSLLAGLFVAIYGPSNS